MVYSDYGHRSAVAVTLLQMLGYHKAESILNGLNGWMAAGFPLSNNVAVKDQPQGAGPEVNLLLLKALDEFLNTMPEHFYAVSPLSAAKMPCSDQKPFLIGLRRPDVAKAAGYIGDREIHVPITEVARILDQLPPDKRTCILVYCAIGNGSASMMTLLHLLGYTNVYSIRGGFDNWVRAGLPINKK